MKPVAKGVSSLLTSLLVVGFTAPNQAWGQPIQAASDGTGTVVIPNGNRYDIQKGIRSPDGTNLFHSFERFGLSDGQIANFLSSPEIRNILGRVVGKEPSVINGLIQVTGGNSNLFLMNPAGILFGAGASLNVPASFTATTATGIGFGGNNWFNAFGINTYENLIGNPNEFAFDFSQLGRIENEGNLTVGAGQSLTLLGGSVTNKGQVTAPGGNIIIGAVEGEKLVRISQPGQVLSLEISPPRDSSGQVLPVQPMDLPAMLTGNGGQVRNQGQVSANSSNAGSVNVTGTVVYNLGQITADGVNGGRIQIDSKNLLDSGILSASGSDGRGGEIQVKYTGTLIQTASALTSATGTQEGGTIAFYGGKNTVLTTSGSFEATGDLGGFVHLFGQDIRLLAADVNVSGNRGGGEILVGGNVQGNPLNPPSPGGIVNAQNTLVNYSSILRADALTVGNAGKVIVWSDQLTQFAGTIQARGGAVRGGGGFVEVSGKDTLAMTGVVEAGAVNGQAGTLLLDPKNIVIDQTDTTGLFPQFDLIDPNVGGGTGFGSSVVPLSTGNVVVTKPGDNFAADNAGAVYLYNGATGGLISVVTGTQANDQVGSGGVFALSNGNYVVSSDLWNGNRGAATWGNGSIGISGQISGVNSLVGTQANDQVSSGGITALSNGNYVVSSYNWNGNRGAATWGNGSIGISGEISAANSLVGTQPSDYVGDYAGNGITALSNGNYVVGSSFWNGNRGAVTWGNGNIGISGEVSAANSLVGTQPGDYVGGSITALSSGNYVVSSHLWNGNRGAATWGNGSTGISGQISAANSLVGTQPGDYVGWGITALTNGNYVVGSYNWNGGRGAATWGNGSTGISGVVSAANSLVGTQVGDSVGLNITALSNGNYVVSSSYWNGNRGVATWGNGSTGISGEVSAANSLVGTQPNDYVGSGITPLSNGNYVVGSRFWNGNRGAATWGNGSIGISGVVSAANSLVGTQSGDQVSYGIIPLSNGNYVVISRYWNAERGAATWGNGNISISGVVSPNNSLVGTQPGDQVGIGLTALSNGNYVVTSHFWNDNRGAATWGNGSTGISGVVSPANSLVGTQPNDLVGNGGIIALSNGNYVVRSSNWNGFRGAVIWADGTTGRTFDGTNLINPQNSILGRTASAGLGTIVEDPVNGTFLVPFVNEGSGRVTVAPSNPTPPATPIFNPDLFRFTSDPSATVTLSPGILWQTLSAGTSVVLQANNDITVNSPIISSNPLGNGGNLSLQAGRSILVNGDIFTDNGNLTLIANETTANGVVNAQRDPGQAVISIAPGVTLNSGTGDTTLILGTGDGLTNNSGGEITVGNIITDGGDITLINNRGGINAISGILRTGSEENGGAIALSAAGNLTTNNIFTNGQNGKGGDIRLISEGIITTGILSSWSNDQGGDIMLQAAGNITTDDINANGVNGDSGDIHLTSGNDITTGILSTLGNVNGGDIILNAAGNITANSISSSGGNGDSGMIRLDSGGSINIIDASPINLGGITSLSSNANGGDITINAVGNINTGFLPLFSSSAIGNGGNITLKTTSGDITVAGINTEGGTNGAGGKVDITTTQFFRATGSYPNLNGQTASISTSGATEGGTIIIRHGGRGITPFIVGNAGTNGTAGAITTGNLFPIQTLSPRREFLNTYTQNGIQIISVPGQSLPPPGTPPLSIRPNGSATNPQATLANIVGDIVGAETSVNQDPLTGNSSFSWRVPGQGILDTGRIDAQNLLAQGNLNQAVSQIDQALEEDLEDYLGKKLPHETATVQGIRNVLTTISNETKTQAVIIYALKTPQQLELVMVMPEGPPIHKSIPEANAAALEKTLAEFSDTISKPQQSTAYLAPAQQLYQWFIHPLEPHLEKLGIDTLIFCMDAGLRSIPMAALHDGKQFLVEKYSLGTIPSVSLTNSRYNPVKNTQVLAMGASKFQGLPPLPSVPTELNAITQQLGKGKLFLNEEFTLNNLQSQRQSFGIIHLATHADFQPGEAGNSFIQLWDSQLKINELRQMGWYQPPQVELLVLSACRTALGDSDMELGFGGLAVQAGVKSALASLWYVSDGGTLALMSEFYRQLGQPDVTIKAEALRRAQIAMLRGELRLEDGELRGVDSRGLIAISTESKLPENQGFSHPYYWAAFTMIGSPW